MEGAGMRKMERFMPSVAMIVTQFGFAGLNVISKVAMNKGMNPFVMVTYRQLIATLSTAPIAYFMERKTKLKVTWSVMLQIFFCALFGATLNQGLYFAGLKYVSPTIACALNNILPAVTFIIAIPFRMETIGVRSRAGLAKVVGTAVCVGGAMLMTFYKGPQLNMWSSGIRWEIGYQQTSIDQAEATTTKDKPADFIIGSVMVVASCFAWAIWFILQAKMSRTFSAPYTSTSLLCLVAAVQCGAMTLCMERDASAWALGWDIRLLTVVYTGVVGSGMAFCIMSWCIQRRGPLFVSMFSPLLLIIVGFFGWALFDEKLHLGSVVGSVFIIVGLYGVLWGKGKEMNRQAVRLDKSNALDDVEHRTETAIEIGSAINAEKESKVGDNNMIISKADSNLSVDDCSKILVDKK